MKFDVDVKRWTSTKSFLTLTAPHAAERAWLPVVLGNRNFPILTGESNTLKNPTQKSRLFDVKIVLLVFDDVRRRSLEQCFEYTVEYLGL